MGRDHGDTLQGLGTIQQQTVDTKCASFKIQGGTACTIPGCIQHSLVLGKLTRSSKGMKKGQTHRHVPNEARVRRSSLTATAASGTATQSLGMFVRFSTEGGVSSPQKEVCALEQSRIVNIPEEEVAMASLCRC